MMVTLFKAGKDGKTLYYTIHDRQQLLTATYALTVAWRTGNGKEREKVYAFENLAELDLMIRTILAKRVKDGYRLLYSWSRDARWTEGEIATAAANGAGGLLAKARATLRSDSGGKRLASG